MSKTLASISIRILGFYFLILSIKPWNIPTATPNCYLSLVYSSSILLLAMARSTDYLILDPLKPTRKPSNTFSTSASVIPSWLLYLSNYLNIWINWALDFWFWERFWYPLDRLAAPSLVKISALISKLPTSGKVTPSRMTLSRSPTLDLLVSRFLLTLFNDYLRALLVATSAKIISFLARMMSSFFFNSA